MAVKISSALYNSHSSNHFDVNNSSWIGEKSIYAWYPPACAPFTRLKEKDLNTLDDLTNLKNAVELSLKGTQITKPVDDKYHKTASAINFNNQNACFEKIREECRERFNEPLPARLIESAFTTRTTETPNRYDTCVWKRLSRSASAKQEHVLGTIPKRSILRYPRPEDFFVKESKLECNNNKFNEPGVSSHSASTFTDAQKLRPSEINSTNNYKLKRPKTAPAFLTSFNKSKTATAVGNDKIKTIIEIDDIDAIPAQDDGIEPHSESDATKSTLIPAAAIPKMDAEQELRKLAQECRDLADEKLQDPYEKVVKMYGWRAQLHGDPYGLKTQCIPPRLSNFLILKEPEVLPAAPTMVKTNCDTFFHETIPKVVLSYDISPNFSSEKFNAIREKLRKSGKWNYMDKVFSFPY